MSKTFYWAFQLFDTSEEECKKFKFEMELINDSNGKCQIVRAPCTLLSKKDISQALLHTDMTSCSSSEDMTDIIWFKYDQISQYIAIDNSFSFRVRMLEDL